MIDKIISPDRNVIDFLPFQQGRKSASKPQAFGARLCRHCGAALGEGESDDDCSSAGVVGQTPPPIRNLRRFRAE